MGCTSSSPVYHPHDRVSLVKHVDRVKAINGEDLNIRDITMLMWNCRDNHDDIEQLVNILVDNSNRRHLFDGVEFYLPQLVHMIIHVEKSWPQNTLQAFSLMIAQHSLHFALQLNWILVASMEDYQPEDEFGVVNPNGDPVLFSRCALLLHQLECAVVYGDSAGDNALVAAEKELQLGNITKEEFNQRQIEYRHRIAKEISEHDEKNHQPSMKGKLLYKRWTRTGVMGSKQWKEREFRIQYKVLYCYRSSDMSLKRVIPLHHVTVEATNHHAHRYYFEVREDQRERVYKLVAPDEKTRDQWIDAIRLASKSPPRYQPLDVDGSKLSPAQLARFEMFSKERAFVRSLTDLCEELRFVDVPDRKRVLKEKLRSFELPDDVYLPLCKSTDPWFTVTNILPEKAHPFSTRERCPCLFTFDATNVHVDVAHYMIAKEKAGMKQFPESSSTRSLRDVDVAPESAEESDAADAKKSKTPTAAASSQITSLWQQESEEEESKYTISSVNSMTKPMSSRKLDASTPKSDTQVKMIAKSNDDLRQEVFIMQLIQFLQDVWDQEKLDILVCPYRILSTSKDTGVMEVVDNANSIDGWKKDYLEEKKRPVRLLEHFQLTFKDEGKLEAAKREFARTMAGYSVATYVLGIKDRHNGNIMLNDKGRIVHIDFGFVLGMAPGKDKVPHTNFSMERAAFKLTPEMSEVIGGVGSPMWDEYVKMCLEGFEVARKHHETILTLVDIMSFSSKYPCFNQPGGGAARVMRELKGRLMLSATPDAARKTFAKLIHRAHNHRGTMFYESFQKKSNDYEPLK